MASIFAFEFSTVTTYEYTMPKHRISYMTAGIFLGLALIMGILVWLRPSGADGLIAN